MKKRNSKELWSIPIEVVRGQMSVEQFSDGLKRGDPSIMAFARRFGTKLT